MEELHIGMFCFSFPSQKQKHLKVTKLLLSGNIYCS